MVETTEQIQTEEVNLLDEKARKAVYGILKSPLLKVVLGNAKAKTAGVKVTGLRIDEAGIHFVLEDTKINKTRRVVIGKEDLEQIIRFVME